MVQKKNVSEMKYKKFRKWKKNLSEMLKEVYWNAKWKTANHSNRHMNEGLTLLIAISENRLIVRKPITRCYVPYCSL
jgi:hypothetical protein